MIYLAIFSVIYLLCMCIVLAYRTFTGPKREEGVLTTPITPSEWNFWSFTPIVNVLVTFHIVWILIKSFYLTVKKGYTISFHSSINILPTIMFGSDSFSMAIVLPFYGVLVIERKD